jgi:hypothetical protein
MNMNKIKSNIVHIAAGVLSATLVAGAAEGNVQTGNIVEIVQTASDCELRKMPKGVPYLPMCM